MKTQSTKSKRRLTREDVDFLFECNDLDALDELVGVYLMNWDPDIARVTNLLPDGKRIPKFTLELESAFVLIERNLQWNPNLFFTSEDRWTVQFLVDGAEASAETLPLAIVRAALYIKAKAA